MGLLEETAKKIVEFSISLNPKTDGFVRSDNNAWVMRPDNWIALEFHYTHEPSLTISLGSPPELLKLLCPRLQLKPGQFGWSKIYLTTFRELDDALIHMENAYYLSKNDFRGRDLPKPIPLRLADRFKLVMGQM